MFLLLSCVGLAQDMPFAADRLVVKFSDAARLEDEKGPIINRFHAVEINALNERYGFLRASRIHKGNTEQDATGVTGDISRIYLMYFSKELAAGKAAEAYMRTGYFEYAEPDYRGKAAGIFSADTLPDDPYFFRQWYLYNNATFTLSNSTFDADIDMELAWLKQKGKPAVVVAVMDSGTRLDHPEFDGRHWINVGEIPGNNLDDDYDGYRDDVNGYDFAYGDPDPSDDNGHGTAMAGLIAANRNNGTGYAGVDWNCRIMSCKVLESDGFGYYSAWVEAIFYAVDHGADVINMSLSRTEASGLLTDGIKYAEANMVTVVAAMGNDDTDQRNFPAALASCLAVGSTDSDDRRSRPFIGQIGTGSNYGNHIDVVAPGNYIYILDYVNVYDYNYYAGGTSVSTALVSGVAALLKAQDPARNPGDIRQILRNTAQDMVGTPGIDAPGWDAYYGYGRINADAALSAASSSLTGTLPEGIAIFPNPTDGDFRIVFRLFGESDVEVTFYDRMGRPVRNTVAFEYLAPGTYSLPFSLNNLSGGVYFMLFEHAEGKEMRRIVVF